MDIFQAVFLNKTDEFYARIDDVDLNVVDEFGRNLLHMAIAYGRQTFATELVHRGIDVNRRDSRGRTPLYYAAALKQFALAKVVLEKGADPAIKDTDGNTPLWAAAIDPRPDYRIVQLLREYGANPRSKNNHGKSALDLAKEENDEELLKLFAE